MLPELPDTFLGAGLPIIDSLVADRPEVLISLEERGFEAEEEEAEEEEEEDFEEEEEEDDLEWASRARLYSCRRRK